MPNSLGTTTGLAGIPSLLISNLGQIEDPEIKKALYQIQNWCNSVGLVNGVTGTGTAGFGSTHNSPALFPGQVFTWVPVSINGDSAYIPVWV